MSSNPTPESLFNAYTTGYNTAKSLMVGDAFTGAFQAAVDAGHPEDTAERRVFVTGYLHGLDTRGPRGIVTDGAGRIVEYEGKYADAGIEGLYP